MDRMSPARTNRSRSAPAAPKKVAAPPKHLAKGGKKASQAGAEPAPGGGVEIKVFVKPVASAIRILRYLSQTGRPEKVTQLARELKLNRSTCFNILRTLVAEGVLEFDPIATTYRIGLGMVKLVENIRTEGERLAAAEPYMHELAEEFGVSITLWRRIGSDRIVLACAESAGGLRIHMPVGQRLPLLLGATGRATALHLGMTKAQLRAEFNNLRWARPLSFDTYWRDAQEAYHRGWAVDDGTFSEGVEALAAPVLSPGGQVSFSLVAVFFRGQLDQQRIPRLGEDMKLLASRLGTLLF